MWSLASLVLAFCFCVPAQINEIEDWVWLKARYEDLEDTQRKFIEIKERSRLGVHSSSNFQVFERNDEVYVGFSYNNDQITHNIDSYLIQWDLEDTEFEDQGPQPRPTGTGYEEAWTSIYYFQTADGETWAYHAFVHADDINERYPDPVTLRGDSYLYKFDDGANNFEAEPTYRVYSQQASVRTTYFTTPDSREFLWTANFAQPFSATGTPNCTVHEYRGGAWAQVYLGYNCSKYPRAPVVFESNAGEWLYLDTAYAQPGSGGSNTAGVGQRFWTYRTNGLVTADVMDNLAFTNVNMVSHFVNSDWDYFVALTDSSVMTYRLHWVTHRAQELPALRLSRSPLHMHMFDYLEHTCLSISYGGYPGLNEMASSIQETYWTMHCWDEAHDRWNLVIKVPSFGVIKTETFWSDDRLFLVALQNDGHIHEHTFTTYEIMEWYDDEFLVTREAEPDSYEMYKKVMDMAEELDDLHHYKAMIIATLALLGAVFILLLLILVKGMSGGGGGGGGGDYQSFS